MSVTVDWPETASVIRTPDRPLAAGCRARPDTTNVPAGVTVTLMLIRDGLYVARIVPIPRSFASNSPLDETDTMVPVRTVHETADVTSVEVPSDIWAIARNWLVSPTSDSRVLP